MNDFDFIQLLGEGGFGAVYLARERSSNDLVAIKALRKRYTRSFNGESLLNERGILIMTIRSGHRNLVNMRSSFQNNTHLFLVLDYAPGGDLYEWIGGQQRDVFPFLIKLYAAELVLAVEALHNLGM